MEKTIQIVIYIHAAFGGIALLAGLVSIIAKKGKNIHRKSGLIFFYSMVVQFNHGAFRESYVCLCEACPRVSGRPHALC